LVVHDSLAPLGMRPGVARLRAYRHDYFKVNEILEACLRACVDLLAVDYGCASTRRALHAPFGRPLVERAVMRLLITWRARVWTDIEALLSTETHEERQHLAARIDRRSGRIAQALCSAEALSALLHGQSLPFRLSRAPATWPDVRVPLLSADQHRMSPFRL